MITAAIDTIKDFIRTVPDFPIKGIQFIDITTAIKKPELFNLITEEISKPFINKGITKVVAIESRGFIIGGALAYKLGAGLVPVRKGGKLPSETHSITYDLEYGTDTLEIHSDALNDNDVILLHDDLLATGGTALATLNLIKKFHVKKAYVSFIVELDFLEGRNKLSPLYEVHSLVHY